MKMGIARQLRPAAIPKAAVNPYRCATVPITSDPMAIPVSNAPTMLPNVRARRRGSLWIRTYVVNAGQAPPIPIPKRIPDTMSSGRLSATARTAKEMGIAANEG